MKRLLVLLALAATVVAVTGAVVRYPAPVTRTLPNGLRVVVFQRPGLPIVQAQLQAPAGLAAEAKGHDGLASLTAQLLRQGTTSRSAEDFATELDTLGATLAVNVTRDAGQVAAGCRVSEFEGVLELMSDAVVNPLFSEEAFQLVRRQVAGQLGQQAQNPAALADERAAALAFGSHPYGHGVRGNLESLLGATRDQVREFHRDHWRPDRAVLVIAGDIDAERAFASAAEWFGRWSGKSVAEAAHEPPAPRKGVVVYDLPGSPVTEVRAALLGPGRADAGYAGWAVAREALEGGLLPAGAHATLLPGREATLLLVNASARPESTAVVAGRVKRALQTLASPAGGGDAVAGARRRAAEAWPLSLETVGQWIASWLAGDVAGLPADHLATMPAAFASAGLDGVAKAVNGGYTLLLAGPAERMKGRLASLGAIDTLQQAAPSPVVEAGVKVSEEQRKRGKALIAQAVLAHGGAARLAAAKVAEQAAELHMSVAGRDLTGEVRTLRVDPARLVHLTRFLEFEHRQVLDGTRGWTLSTAGDSATMIPADSTTLLSFRGIFESDLVHVLRAASDPEAAPYSVGRGTIDQKPVDRVEFSSRLGIRTRLSLDATSHRVVAVESLPTPQGVWRDRRHWSDYILVEGVWWPRQEMRELDGEQVSRSVLRRIVVNDPVDTTLFRRPIVVRGQVRGLE